MIDFGNVPLASTFRYHQVRRRELSPAAMFGLEEQFLDKVGSVRLLA